MSTQTTRSINGATTYKDIDFYLSLPWEYVVETHWQGPHKYFIIKVKGLEYVSTIRHQSLDEAMKEVQYKMVGKIKQLIREQKVIPIPDKANIYTGKIAYRTTSKIHGYIDQAAKLRNLSLSKMINLLVLKGLQHLNHF